MLEDIREDIQWAIDRLHDIKGDENTLADIWAIIKRLDETMKMIDAEITGYDSDAEMMLMEDIEEQERLKFKNNRNLE